MTEPSEIAETVEEVVDGVWHWQIHNANIGGAISSAHAIATDGAHAVTSNIVTTRVDNTAPAGSVRNSSTARSASKRSDQREKPSGGGPQLSATKCASKSPSALG